MTEKANNSERRAMNGMDKEDGGLVMFAVIQAGNEGGFKIAAASSNGKVVVKVKGFFFY